MSEKRPVREELSEKNMMIRGIPKHFLKVTIDDFNTYGEEMLENAKNIVSDYISDIDDTYSSGRGLYLYGSNGVGKSMLGSIIVKEAYKHRYSSKRITFVEYINEYTKIWKSQSIDEKEYLEDLFYSYTKAVDFLVLEEIGKENTKPDLAVTILEDCLRYREEHGLCTVICTNISLKDLISLKYQSKSVESLIRGSMTPVKIIGVDRRSDYEKR